MYKCNKCSKIFKQKNDLKRHLNRKNPCKKIVLNCNDLTCPKCHKSYAHKSSLSRHMNHSCISNQIASKLLDAGGTLRKQSNINVCAHDKQDNYIDNHTQDTNSKNNTPKSTKNSLYNLHEIHQNPPNSTNLTCNYCFKTFSRSDSLNRHLDDRCKVKKESDNEKEVIFNRLIAKMEKQEKELKNLKAHNNKLENEIKSLKDNNIQNINSNNNSNNRNIHNNTTNNTNTVNSNNTINNNVFQLVAFGQEDLTSISDKIYEQIIKKGFQSVPNFVRYVHFNKNKPENHNIYISNMRDNYVMVFDGNKWTLNNRNDILTQLIDDKKYCLIDKFDEIMDTLDPIAIRKFKRFLEQHDEDQIIKNMKKDLVLVLYNNKDMPENTRKISS